MSWHVALSVRWTSLTYWTSFAFIFLVSKNITIWKKMRFLLMLLAPSVEPNFLFYKIFSSVAWRKTDKHAPLDFSTFFTSPWLLERVKQVSHTLHSLNVQTTLYSLLLVCVTFQKNSSSTGYNPVISATQWHRQRDGWWGRMEMLNQHQSLFIGRCLHIRTALSSGKIWLVICINGEVGGGHFW